MQCDIFQIPIFKVQNQNEIWQHSFLDKQLRIKFSYFSCHISLFVKPAFFINVFVHFLLCLKFWEKDLRIVTNNKKWVQSVMLKNPPHNFICAEIFKNTFYFLIINNAELQNKFNSNPSIPFLLNALLNALKLKLINLQPTMFLIDKVFSRHRWLLSSSRSLNDA